MASQPLTNPKKKGRTFLWNIYQGGAQLIEKAKEIAERIEKVVGQVEEEV
jgi:hypothetical protein